MNASHLKRFSIAVLILTALYLLPVPAYRLTDLVTGQPADGFAVTWPLWRYLAEPFSATGAYVLSFSRYILQLLSWMFWLGIAAVAAALLRRRGAGAAVKGALSAWTVFLTVVVLSLLLPLPAPRLQTPQGMEAADFHSHTFYSHDGVSGPERSLAYHRRLGFDFYFNTEHNHSRGFPHYPDAVKLRTVFPGMQMSTTEKISLLVLADREFDGEEFRHKTIRGLIDEAHRRGFAVVVPHWWKWRYPSWETLYGYGVDGFEVYNAGYRNFSEEERGRLIRFCRERGLLMTGSTDWHGWGGLSNVWTVLDASVRTAPDGISAALRRHPVTKVVIYHRPEYAGTLRWFFEPFVGIYYYFGGMEFRQLVSWVLWLGLVFLAAPLAPFRKAGRFLPAAMAVFFFALAGYYLLLWLPLRAGGNDILGRLLAPVLAVLGLFWILVWRVYRGKTSDKA